MIGAIMYLVRNVFKCKPGKAKELVAKFKAAEKYLPKESVISSRVMTDVVSGFWTVVTEFEVPSLAAWDKMSGSTTNTEMGNAMKDYMTLVEGGHREIFKIE
jgi:hypothetical protein